jgi:hypothetical protein
LKTRPNADFRAHAVRFEAVEHPVAFGEAVARTPLIYVMTRQQNSRSKGRLGGFSARIPRGASILKAMTTDLMDRSAGIGYVYGYLRSQFQHMVTVSIVHAV